MVGNAHASSTHTQAHMFPRVGEHLVDELRIRLVLWVHQADMVVLDCATRSGTAVRMLNCCQRYEPLLLICVPERTYI